MQTSGLGGLLVSGLVSSCGEWSTVTDDGDRVSHVSDGRGVSASGRRCFILPR
jgi:hypothetical protein